MNEPTVVSYNMFPDLELNIVIRNEYLVPEFIKDFFDGEPYKIIHSSWDMYDILWMFGIFKSKTEARKNWTRTGKEIPPGYNEFRDIGKQKKSLYIWNPFQYYNEEGDPVTDITMCNSKTCGRKEQCYRFTATPCQAQSYCDFYLWGCPEKIDMFMDNKR